MCIGPVSFDNLATCGKCPEQIKRTDDEKDRLGPVDGDQMHVHKRYRWFYFWSSAWGRREWAVSAGSRVVQKKGCAGWHQLMNYQFDRVVGISRFKAARWCGSSRLYSEFNSFSSSRMRRRTTHLCVHWRNFLKLSGIGLVLYVGKK